MVKTKIISNKAQCPKCKDIIESTHVHDFKRCTCQNIAVDGGRQYLRRLWSVAEPIELSETKEVEDGADRK